MYTKFNAQANKPPPPAPTPTPTPDETFQRRQQEAREREARRKAEYDAAAARIRERNAQGKKASGYSEPPPPPPMPSMPTKQPAFSSAPPFTASYSQDEGIPIPPQGGYKYFTGGANMNMSPEDAYPRISGLKVSLALLEGSITFH
jgi:hypothetical protein